MRGDPVTVTFKTNLDRFNDALADYVSVTRLSTQEAVAKKSADFAFRLSTKMKSFSPGKGVIRAERLAALKSGEGVKIRPSAWERAYKTQGVSQDIKTRKFAFNRRGKTYGSKRIKGGKRLNLQAIAVQKELNIRDSGRGFLGYATTLKSVIQKFAIKDDIDVYRTLLDRYNRFLSSVGFKTDADKAEMTFKWGGNKSSGEIAVALQKPKQQTAIAQALDESRADMLEYILKRQNRAKAPLRSI
jgi:hypothetical protein